MRARIIRLVFGSKRPPVATTAVQIRDDQRELLAAGAVSLGAILAVLLLLAGVPGGAVAVPFSIGVLVALAIVPFPAADRWLALALIGTFPLLPPLGLPNVPLAAGAIGVTLLRLGLRGSRPPMPIRALAILAVLWGTLAAGLAVSTWPALSVWLRPLALLIIGAFASLLGVIVWLESDRRDRWLDGLGIGLVIVSMSAVAIFMLQHFASVVDVRDAVVGLMGLFRGELAAAKFADQNNWIIFGDELTLRALSPLFPAPNNLGGYIGLTLPLIAARWFLAPAGRWRTVAGVAGVMGVLALVLTISRSSWVAACVAIAVLIVIVIARSDLRTKYLGRNRGRVAQAAAAVVIIGAIGALAIASVGQRGIEDRLVHPLDDPSVQGRIEIGESAVEAMRADLIRGVGLGNWRATIQEGDYIHNVYLEYGVALGLFGAVWAVLLIAIPFAAGTIILARRPVGSRTLLGLALLGGAMFNATQFLFDDNLLVPQYAWLTCWAIGGSLALANSRDPEPRDHTTTPAT